VTVPAIRPHLPCSRLMGCCLIWTAPCWTPHPIMAAALEPAAVGNDRLVSEPLPLAADSPQRFPDGSPGMFKASVSGWTPDHPHCIAELRPDGFWTCTAKPIAVRNRAVSGHGRRAGLSGRPGRFGWGVVTNKPGWLAEPLLKTLATLAAGRLRGQRRHARTSASPIRNRCCTPASGWARPRNARCTWATPNATCWPATGRACARWWPASVTWAPKTGRRNGAPTVFWNGPAICSPGLARPGA
jgi:hypothetical protein